MADKFIPKPTAQDKQKVRENRKEAKIEAERVARAKNRKTVANVHAGTVGASKGAMNRPVGTQMPLHLANEQSRRSAKENNDLVEVAAASAAHAVREAGKRTRATKPLRAPQA